MRSRVLLPGSVAALLAIMVLAVCIGAVQISVFDTGRVIAAHIAGDTSRLEATVDTIVWDYRLPRVFLAALCGGGLALAGVVLQALVANPLADPYVLGLSSGASLGAVTVIVLGGGVLGGVGVSTAAFVGALLATLIVVLLGRRDGRLDPTRLVLAGVAVGYLFLALTNYVQLRASPTELRSVLFWTLGSVSGAGWDRLGPVAVSVLAVSALLLALGRQLNALITGDEQATALGVDVRRLRLLLLVLASVLTGVLISAAGGIGFVGLMIPHMVRLVVGLDHRRVLPLSLTVGAGYLVLVDLLSRSVDPPNELPLGIFTAAFGAPFFLWLLHRGRAQGAVR